MEGKLIIVAAPSGSGKSTIVHYLLDIEELNLHFSVSATSRAPRGTEQHGIDYYFMSPEEFRAHIDADDFIEYEEVYTDKFYGTLKSEVDNRLAAGENIIFDVDVKGALNIKKQYGNQALCLFIMPPSIEELRLRLVKRGTDSPEVIEQRLAKAEYELSFADQFDEQIVNDVLEVAEVEAEALISDFISSNCHD